MVEGDIFREVEEDMRREQIARAWDKYGVYVLTAAALIVFGAAGYSIWNWMQDKKATETGEAFVKAVDLGDEGKKDEMVAAFGRIAETGGRGYAALAKLRVAAALVESGKTEEAASKYLEVASDALIDDMLRGYARVQWAALALDKTDAEALRKGLEAVIRPDNPWRHSGREYLGLAYYKAGNFEEAQRLFLENVADEAAPPELRRRAQTMLALLTKPRAPETPKDKEKEPAGDGAKSQ
jgi:hypothetical protein